MYILKKLCDKCDVLFIWCKEDEYFLKNTSILKRFPFNCVDKCGKINHGKHHEGKYHNQYVRERVIRNLDRDLTVGRGMAASLFTYEIEEGKYFHDVDNMKFPNEWINVKSTMILIPDERINKKSAKIILSELSF